MTADMTPSIRASRLRVPRSRGAVGGALLMVLGAWAALVAFIGPYFNLAYTPRPNDAWHWTAARAYLEMLPGAAALLGGLLLILSTSRLTASFGGWLAAAGGAWLIVGPPLADVLDIKLGTPDPASGKDAQAAEMLLLFYAVGAAMLFFAAIALGRLSVHSVRDVRAAERRTAAEEAAVAEERRRIMSETPPPAYQGPADAGRHQDPAGDDSAYYPNAQSEPMTVSQQQDPQQYDPQQQEPQQHYSEQHYSQQHYGRPNG
jgi:hypothetical protein